jgi:S1-C subfamily serine protease
LAPAANNPENAHEGVYNVRDAQENREGEPAQPESRNNATAVRPEGLRELHLQRSPNFQGYGFHLQYNRAYYLVQRIEEGSPAEQAGLYANDVICKLERQPTESMAHDDFVQKVSNSSDITMVVQYVDEYLRANPQPPRNQQVASAVTAALNNENDKLKIGPLKALNKITNR